jgi:hypothetical protein
LHFFGFLCLHLCDYFCKLAVLFILKRGGGCQSLRCLYKGSWPGKRESDGFAQLRDGSTELLSLVSPDGAAQAVMLL